jgi:CRP-like cAMP-binding protein
VTLSVAPARTDAERERVFRFRYRIYVEELGLSPPEADHAGRRLRDRLDDDGVSFALADGEDVVGSLRVLRLSDVSDPAPLVAKFGLEPAIEAFGPEAIATTSRFMLDPRLRHGTAVFRLMQAAYEAFPEARLNYGDCSPHLVPFYEHLGYRRYTRAYDDTAYGFKVPILMLLRDRERFERVRSPLARLARERPDDAAARAWFASTYPDYVGLESAAFLPEGVFFDVLASRVSTDPLHALRPLRGLDRAEAERFLAEATTVRAEPGRKVLRQGERGDAVFVLLSGVAEVFVDGAAAPVAVLGAGDPFGEIGFLTSEPRTADVVARSPCEVLVLSGEFLQRFLRKEPAIASKVLLDLSRVLAGRLATTTRRAASPSPRPALSEFLRAPGSDGWVGALLDEYARAAGDLCRVVEALPAEEFARERESADPDARSIRAVCEHVASAATGYAHYVRRMQGLPAPLPGSPERRAERRDVPTPDALRPALAEALRGTEEAAEGLRSRTEAELLAMTLKVSWGAVHDPESILEHAVVHLLRHRRQVERWRGGREGSVPG